MERPQNNAVHTLSFFASYPKFLETSETGATLDRLDARFSALIESQRSLISGCRILDLGSHDGRWTFAALKNNATSVVAVEPRETFIRQALNTFAEYGIDPAQYEFLQTTAQSYLEKCGDNTFDTVFCFGLLYHLDCFEEILTHCQRVATKAVLVDSMIFPSPRNEVWEGEEDSHHPSNGIGAESLHRIRVPSQLALTETLTRLGFEISFYPWRTQERKSWRHLDDYFFGQRITVRALVKNEGES
jgi:ubiquinone/menaquinone biosynthesis C-methylase UbiE